jgi:RHS repeat-associated protein
MKIHSSAYLILFGFVVSVLATAAFSAGSCSASSGTGNPRSEQAACNASQPASQSRNNEPDVAAGNPINIITGNKYQREVDLIALPGELGIEVIRHYNSLATHETGHVGKGWRLSYETELRPSENSIELIQADGAKLLFRCADQVCKTGNYAQGIISVNRKRDSAPSYTWRWLAGIDAGRLLHFDKRGLLQSIHSKTGASLTIERSSEGKIVRIIDPLARQLIFHYPSPAELKAQPLKFDGVSAIETPVGRINFQYGSPTPQGISTEHTDRTVQINSRPFSAAYVLRQSNLITAQFTPLLNKLAPPNKKNYEPLAAKEYRYESTYEGQHAHLTGIVLKGQRQTTYMYDAAGLAILSTRGEPAKLRVDSSGALVIPKQLADGTGIEQVVLQRNRQGETLLINSLGKETVYKHALIAGAPRLVSVRGPGCSSCSASDMRYQYDTKGRLTHHIQLSADGLDLQAQVTTYDSNDRPIKTERHQSPPKTQGSSVELIKRFEYANSDPAALHLPVAIIAKSRVSGKEKVQKLKYSDEGLLTEISEEGYSPLQPNSAQRRIKKMQYVKVHNQWVLASIDGPLNNGPLNSPSDSDITLFKYEKQIPLLTQIVAPGGFETSFNYDVAGRLNQQNSNDRFRETQTTISYASAGAVANEVATMDQVAWLLQTSLVGEHSQRIASSEKKINVLTRKFNAAQLIETTDAAGRTINFQYGKTARPYGFSDAQGHRSEERLNAESQLLRSALFMPNESHPHRASYVQYDDYGRAIHRLSADGQVESWRYNVAHRLATYISGDHTAHHFTQNAFAHLTADQSADGQLRINIEPKANLGLDQWDDFGQKVFTYLPDHGNRHHKFDAAGRLQQTTQIDGSNVSYEWDPANRLTKKIIIGSGGEQTSVRFSYQGRLIDSVEDAEQTTRFEQDALGRTVAETTLIAALQGQAAAGFRTETSYNEQGLVIARRLADGRLLHLNRSSVTQGAGVTALSLQSTWAIRLSNLFPAAAKWLGMSPIATQIATHAFDGLTSLRLGNNVKIKKEFDLAGRVAVINDGTLGDQVFNYGVGPKIQSIQTNGAIGQTKISFAYTGFGQLKPPPERVSFTNSKRPIQDNRGRVINDAQFSYTYTAHGQIATVSHLPSGALVAEYRYNGLKQRVSKTVYRDGTVQKYYYLWRDEKLVAEIDSNGQVVAQYLYMIEATKLATPIAKLYAHKTLYIHSDHRATPIAMTNDQQKIVWQKDANTANEETLNIRFPGQYYDQETGLHDNWHRSFNPATGSYLQPDPLGYPDGPNAYLYASGDPINKVDVKGLYETDVHYYMTYFLARMAGISAAESYTIALAAQYIDDNPDTWPVDDNNRFVNMSSPAASTRLEYYHFTTTSPHWFSGINYDPPRTTGELAYYALTRQEAYSYIVRRYKNPANAQIAKLAGYASSADNRCRKAQFFGEYLHAFEDTFAHRDKLNAPIDTNRGAGHAYYGHAPDKTYNHIGAASISLGEFGPWTQNEARTLQMEFEVFGKMRAAYSSTGRNVRTNSEIRFRDFGSFLEDWNRTQDNQDKVLQINDKLADFGFGPVPAYDRICAESKRKEYIGGLKQNLYSGTILPVRAAPAGTAAASCGG